jgi:hypothetical protein
MRMPQQQRARARIVAAVGAIALAAGALGFADVDGSAPLAGQLGSALSLRVRADSLIWIGPSPEPGLGTATAEREIAFLASKGERAPADLYRAEVRLAPGPRVIGAGGLRNLTDSEDGDDFAIAASWPHIAVVTRALGQVRSITVFDVRGQELPRDGSWSLLERALARLTDVQRAGRAAGFGRTSVRFEHPPTAVDLSFAPGGKGPTLLLEWADRDGTRHLASVDLEAGRTEAATLAVSTETRLPKRPILWGVDTMRAVWWVGPGPIEWAEGRFFALKDRLHRWEYALLGDDEDEGDAELGADGVAARSALAKKALPKPPSGLEIGALEARIEWPPPPVGPPVFKSRRRGEGE